jgi:hypothetical protein
MLKRIPPFIDIVSVYAVIASMLFAWSIILFIWYLPSWLYFMDFSDLIGVFCYVMASSFFESIAFLLFLLFLSILLPLKFFRDEFVPRGTSIAICMIGLIMLNAYHISIPRFLETLVLAAVVVSFLSTKIPLVRQALMWLSDRLIIFLYILIPLSFLSVLIIVARNII